MCNNEPSPEPVKDQAEQGVEELLASLRRKVEVATSIGTDGFKSIKRLRNPDGIKAATTIVALQKREAGLREALRPFAEAAGKLDGLWSDDDWRWNDGTVKRVTIGDLRRASKALGDQT